ncbi:MAG TPA: hypothetical protein VGE01_08870 [Fimbriimonas sp.]
MLKVALLAFLVAASQDTAVFKDDQLRLAFTHPGTWTVSKRQKDMTTYSLPIENTTDRATLEIARASFRSEPEVWQKVQEHANKQLQREVVRQWQQEILGVPMLLTLIRYSEKGVSMNTLTGLLYTRTPLKMLFRLTGPESDFEKVEFEFQNTIQTLRSFEEGGLEPEDPSKPAVTAPKVVEKIDIRPPKKVTFESTASKPQVIVGPVVVDLTVSTRKMQARLPKGWTFEEVKENGFLARHPDLAAPVAVDVYSVLDSDPPKNALFKKSSASLGDFKVVAKRQDVIDKPTNGQMTANAVWRTGETAAGKAFTFDGVVANDEHYALLSYRSANESERNLLEELLSILSVAPAP